MFHFVPNEYVKANLTWHSSDLYSFKTMFNYHHYLIYFFVFLFTNCYWYQWYLFCVQYSLHNMLIHAKLLIIYMYYIGRFYDNGYIYSIYVYVFGFILKTNSKSLYVKRCFEFVYNFIWISFFCILTKNKMNCCKRSCDMY